MVGEQCDLDHDHEPTHLSSVAIVVIVVVIVVVLECDCAVVIAVVAVVVGQEGLSRPHFGVVNELEWMVFVVMRVLFANRSCLFFVEMRKK